MPDFVHYELNDRVAVLTIDNPPVNALGQGVWEAIDGAVARAAGDAGADAIVLIGAGQTFVAGADINLFKLLKTREQSLTRSAHTHAMLRRLEDSPKPLVAAIHGQALGGGLELAMACHYRVAAKDAVVGQPEVLLGIIPGGGGTQRLPRLVGPARAKELIWSGRHLRADEAAAIGLVDRVVADDEVETAALAWAASFGRGAVVAMGLAKRAIDRGLDGPLAAGLALEADAFVDVFGTEDAAHGVRSFLEHGPGRATFEGR
jgi:enoyl-CoA hydratase/carnithine racemase